MWWTSCCKWVRFSCIWVKRTLKFDSMVSIPMLKLDSIKLMQSNICPTQGDSLSKAWGPCCEVPSLLILFLVGWGSTCSSCCYSSSPLYSLISWKSASTFSWSLRSCFHTHFLFKSVNCLEFCMKVSSRNRGLIEGRFWTSTPKNWASLVTIPPMQIAPTRLSLMSQIFH